MSNVKSVKTIKVPKDRLSFGNQEARIFMADNPPHTRTISQSRGPGNVVFPKGMSDIGEISWVEPNSNPGQAFRLSFLIWKEKSGKFKRIAIGDSWNSKKNKEETWCCEKAEVDGENIHFIFDTFSDVGQVQIVVGQV